LTVLNKNKFVKNVFKKKKRRNRKNKLRYEKYKKKKYTVKLKKFKRLAYYKIFKYILRKNKNAVVKKKIKTISVKREKVQNFSPKESTKNKT